jgi:S-methylmethionine-dependent homocysteine/selenocysteine methylase
VPATPFRERLLSGPPLVLDAALGTELLRRGANLPPPLWSAQALLDRPDLVEEIHRENAEAGADVLTIASFRLHGRNLRGSSCSLSQGQLIAIAVSAARQAAEEKISSKVNGANAPRDMPEDGRRAARPSDGATRPSKKLFDGAWIAGSLAPLEDCYRPDRVPKQEDLLFSEHAEMAAALAAASVDLILVETMNTVREASAAARAAAATGLPVVVSCVTDGNGRLLSGEPVEAFAHALLSLPSPPDALGINCVAARGLAGDLARLSAAATGVPLAAYGNVFGAPVAPGEYAELAAEWVRRGAHIAGGCCGTTAAHTAAVARRITGSTPGSSSRAASGS